MHRVDVMAYLMQAGMGVLAIKLLTFRRWNDEIPYARKFFIAFVLLLVELGVENFFTWCTLHRLARQPSRRRTAFM